MLTQFLITRNLYIQAHPLLTYIKHLKNFGVSIRGLSRSFSVFQLRQTSLPPQK